MAKTLGERPGTSRVSHTGRVGTTTGATGSAEGAWAVSSGRAAGRATGAGAAVAVRSAGTAAGAACGAAGGSVAGIAGIGAFAAAGASADATRTWRQATIGTRRRRRRRKPLTAVRGPRLGFAKEEFAGGVASFMRGVALQEERQFWLSRRNGSDSL